MTMGARARRRVAAVLAMVGVALAPGLACYGVPPLLGPYRCSHGTGCPAGLLCDDGVCCNPTGEPLCLSHVLDGGRCHDGGTPRVYFEDQDQDGFGNENRRHLFCARPVTLPVSTDAGDCNDTPEVGVTSYPGASEQCDGYDNDCDGTPDDGLATQTFYEDQDNDGAGDPQRPRPLCAAPASGYSRTPNDCAPEDGTRRPGAPERCNGLDENCNGSVDDSVVDAHQPCDVQGGVGVCRQGRTSCVSGGLQCVPPTPRQDECDGLDNDCDGQADEQPDCGGPADLLSSTAGLSYGAQDVGSRLNGGTGVSGCVKDHDGGRGEFFSKPRWQGSGANSHVFWVEAATGWDLSRPGARLRLHFSHDMFRPAATPWSQHGQPVVYLCDTNGGHLRFVHFDGGTSVPAMTGASGTVDELIPLSGNDTWVIGANANLDVRHVKRVEVLIQPTSSPDGGPTFSIDLRPGFGFLP